MSGPDFNAHLPGAPRTGCTAADKGQALWDVMTVLAGRRPLGSVHADETRGGMDEILELWTLIQEVAMMELDCDMREFYWEHEDAIVGKRRDIVVCGFTQVQRILQRNGIDVDWLQKNVVDFLYRSLVEIFPLSSPERNAIDEMYAEDSQSQWLK